MEELGDMLKKKFLVLVIIGLFIGICFIHNISANSLKNCNILIKTKSNIKNIDQQNNTIIVRPEEEWNKTYGFVDYDEGWYGQETEDKGYIIVCRTAPLYFYHDIMLIKTDKNGNEEWNKTIGGFEDDDIGIFIQQTNDNGYIMVGQKKCLEDIYGNVWLVKTDENGNEQWNKTFGGDYMDFGWCVQQTNDGGYIITGFTEMLLGENRDVWLIKTDINGNEEWNKTFGETKNDEGQFIVQTDDGGYIIVGYTISENPDISGAIWLIKTDINGDIEWDKTFTRSLFDKGTCVKQTNDNGYIITGCSDVSGMSDLWLIKTDHKGNIIWDNIFGGVMEDSARSVDQTNDGGFIIAGQTSSYGAGNLDVWLIKTNENGDKKWDLTFGGIEDDIGQSVQQTSDGGYIITGTTSSYGAGRSDIWLIKTDKHGKGKDISNSNISILNILKNYPFSFQVLKLFFKF